MACFSRSIEHDKYRGTIYRGPQGILKITVEVKKSILWDLIGCGKHKLLEKKADFPLNKRSWPSFSRVFECDKPKGLKCKGPRGIPATTVQVNRLLLGPKWSLQTNISSHSCFHRDKRF